MLSVIQKTSLQKQAVDRHPGRRAQISLRRVSFLWLSEVLTKVEHSMFLANPNTLLGSMITVDVGKLTWGNASDLQQYSSSRASGKAL